MEHAVFGVLSDTENEESYALRGESGAVTMILDKHGVAENWGICIHSFKKKRTHHGATKLKCHMNGEHCWATGMTGPRREDVTNEDQVREHLEKVYHDYLEVK